MTKSKIEIRIYEHTDAALWPLIGPLVTDRAVHTALGGPVFSDATTTWFVAVDHSGVVGMTCLKRAKDHLWFDYGWTHEGVRSSGVFAALDKRRGDYLREAGLAAVPMRTLVRRDRLAHYTRRSWSVRTERGQWVTIEKGGAK